MVMQLGAGPSTRRSRSLGDGAGGAASAGAGGASGDMVVLIRLVVGREEQQQWRQQMRHPNNYESYDTLAT